MSDATTGPLRDAYEAIRANQLPKAREILRAYMVNQPDDADAWWLYTYAVDNTDDARKALENVLRLDSTYPGANDLFNQLNQSVRSLNAPQSPLNLRKLDDLAAVPMTQGQKPEIAFDDVDFGDIDDLDEDDEDESGFSRRRVLLALGGFALVILLVVLVFLSPRQTSAPEATNVAQTTSIGVTANPSLDAATVATSTIDSGLNVSPEPSLSIDLTVTSDLAQATDIPVSTQSPIVGADLGSFSSALDSFDIVPDSVGVEQTTLGQTLSGSVCLQNQGELRTAIPAAISALASASPQAPADVQFIGAKFVNCADNSLMRYVVVSIEDARAFASGSLSASELRSGHRNITR